MIVVLILLILLAIVPFVIVIPIYESNFGRRLDTPVWRVTSSDDYYKMQSERVTYTSDKDQEIVGYLYSKENQQEESKKRVSNNCSWIWRWRTS